MKLSILSIVSALAVPSLARYVLYLDQYHLTTLPNKTTTAGIDTVIMAFANSTLFTTNPAGNYTPFQTVASVRELFDDGAQVMIAIGGWSDNSGFDMGATNETTRALFASNVAQMLDDVGADGVDIDWEYPAGNGADYKIVPNSAKVSEIETYPLLLSAIKCAIGNKTLSIAVPGLERDMIAFTEEQAPKIWESVDMVNVMTYDLMNRRDNITKHHTSINGSLDAIDKYMSLNLTADKINLGFAFYAKYFLTNDTSCATEPLGCATALLEDPTDGSDTGNSGAMTFEIANYQTAPTNLTASTDGSCGASVFAYCDGTASGGSCCSQYGYCGDTNAHCGLTCQPDYGNCTGATAGASWVRALNSSVTDEELGGQYYWDSDASIFWTMDTPALITKKFTDIVGAKGLGGVMAWSAGEDSYDWSHLLALQAGVAELGL